MTNHTYNKITRLFMAEQILKRNVTKFSGNSNDENQNHSSELLPEAIACYCVDPDLSAVFCVLQASTIEQKQWISEHCFTGMMFTLIHKACHFNANDINLLDKCCNGPYFKSMGNNVPGKIIGDIFNRQKLSGDLGPLIPCTPIISCSLLPETRMESISDLSLPCIQIFDEIISPWRILRMSECIIEQRIFNKRSSNVTDFNFSKPTNPSLYLKTTKNIINDENCTSDSLSTINNIINVKHKTHRIKRDKYNNPFLGDISSSTSSI